MRNYNMLAEAILHKLKLPNLKRQCIIRGIPFKDVGNGVPYLQGWFVKNYYNPIDAELLNKYDDWISKTLKERDVDGSMLNPNLNLGFVEKDNDGNIIKNRKIQGISKKKKTQKTSDGLLSGTKKAYIVELQKSGKTKEETIELVKEKYSDINESYVITWYNKSKKGKLKK